MRFSLIHDGESEMDYCAGDSQLFSMRVDENSALHSKKMDVIKDTGTDRNDQEVCV